MRLIHLTDPHLTAPNPQPVGRLIGKRVTGYLAWKRKRRWIHGGAVLDRLVEAVRRESADQVVISGDLAQIGLPEEIRQAGEWLRRLGPPGQVFLVPGNHDNYSLDSWPAIQKEWVGYLPGSEPGAAGAKTGGYPLARTAKGVCLIGASTACPTPLFSARGALGEGQMDRIRDRLAAAQASGMPSILVLHHPPLPGMTSWRRALRERRRLRRILQMHPPVAVFCGHLHRNHDQSLGQTRICCTASASSQHDAAYRVLELEPDTRGWNLDMRLMGLRDSEFIPVASQRWSFRPSG